MTRRVFLWAFLTSLPLVLLTDGLPSLTPLFTQPNILISWLFLGVFGNAVCFAIWNIAFKRLGVVVTNNYLYASPFVTVVVGWLLLDEKISWMSILGAAAPAPFKEVELVGNIGLSRQQERLPAVAAANILKAVEHRLKFFVEIEPRRARLRKVRCSISMKAQFAHCVFGRCACLKLPVNEHRPGNRPGNKAHPKKRENEKTSRKAFKVLQDEHEALRRALRLGGN